MSDSQDDYADKWDSDNEVITYAEKAFGSLANVVNFNGLSVIDFGCVRSVNKKDVATTGKSCYCFRHD